MHAQRAKSSKRFLIYGYELRCNHSNREEILAIAHSRVIVPTAELVSPGQSLHVERVKPEQVDGMPVGVR